jgi:hypothetical protein
MIDDPNLHGPGTIDRDNNHNRNAGGDQSVFDGGGAGFVVQDPIPTPKGKPLLTLKDAAAYIMTLPKKVSDVSMPASSYRRCTSPAQQ